MKAKNLFFLPVLLIIGAQAISSQSKIGSLPVIDITKEYPKKEIRLQDIADIEYVALETSDDILLGALATLGYVSDKYIFVYEPMIGDIFVFNRNGKLYSQFNHKGPSGKEYVWMSAGAIFDEKNEEIFVCAQSIQVYSLTGEHKRTLKVNTITRSKMLIHNFDNESLLVYEEAVIEPGLEGTTKQSPYKLISKKDGSLISVLDLHFSKRYSSSKAIVNTNNKTWQPITISYPTSMHWGEDFVVADISSDTIFHLNKKRELIPLLTRKPSVHASTDLTSILSTPLTCDKFMIIGVVTPVFKVGAHIPIYNLMYEFETGEISRITFLYEQERKGRWGPGKSPAIGKNQTAEFIQAESLTERYKLNRLQGNLKKLAETLDENDNPVVQIITFK